MQKSITLPNNLVKATITGLAILISLFAFVPFAAAQSKTALPAAPPAAANNSGQALEIGPPVINLSANPGETVKAQISLRDISNSKLVVTNEINDFVADGENGAPKILLNQTEPSPYSIKSWITPLPQFTLVPKQVQQLRVTVKVPANAAPGGYYGVIRFTGTPPDLEGTGVSLSASLGALVLLTVKGDVKEEVTVEQFALTKDGKTGGIFESAPNGVMERFKNTGNIHEQPVGQVDIKDMFGNLVGTVIVNNPSPRNILPGSIRKFDQPLDKAIGNKWLFGSYTATLTANYGVNNQVLTATTTFWVIPYTLVAIIIIALIVIFALLYFGIRRYNQYIIGQARGRRR